MLNVNEKQVGCICIAYMTESSCGCLTRSLMDSDVTQLHLLYMVSTNRA